MQRRLLYIVLLFLFGLKSIAQTNTVAGRVLDSKTLEPIAFVNVYIPNTTTGTTTDFDGFYLLHSEEKFDSIAVSSLGYLQQTKEVDKTNYQKTNFYLAPTSFDLMEVIIRPGENPAVTLLKKVWKNRAQNSLSNVEQYSVETYTKAQTYLRPFTEKGKESKYFSKFALSTDENEKPIMPVYMGETISEDYYLRLPKREKSIIKATKTKSLIGEDAEMVSQLLQQNNKIDFYQNNIKILDKHFVSPISTAGLFYYKYYLEDSLFIDDIYCYEVRYIPKREEDLTFSGTFWINDSTFALKRITAELGKKANMNFVDRIRIQQDLKQSENGVWYASDTRIMADAVNIFINLYQVQDSFKITNNPLSFYLEQTLPLSSKENKNSFLLDKREYDEIDLLTLKHINSLNKDNSMRFLSSLVNMSVKGYWNLGKVELGPYLMLYSKNPVEGDRVRLGYKTNNSFSEKWISKGHLAYGFKDEKIKYNFQLERFISRKNWSKIGVQVSDEVERLGATDEFYHPNAFFSFASSFGGTNMLQSVKSKRLWWEGDLFKGFNQKVVFLNKSYSPLSPKYLFGYYQGGNYDKVNSEITVSEIDFISIYQPGASMIIDKNERIPVAFNKNPTFTFSYSLGIKDFLKSDFNYHKAMIGINQELLLGSVGRLQYNLKFKKVFSQLPYPLLNHFDANESFFRTANTYNLMRHGEFVSDESAELFLTFRQDGFILDKIPLIKRLKWRSVATTSLAYGAFDEAKNGFYDKENNPNGILVTELGSGEKASQFNTFNSNVPYVEVSYGIENIFSFFRIESIHRITYKDVVFNEEKPSPWGLKFSMVFRF